MKKRFAADRDASFGEKVFDEWSGTPAMTEIETLVEPDGVGDDVRWESIALVGIHPPILPISGGTVRGAKALFVRARKKDVGCLLVGFILRTLLHRIILRWHCPGMIHQCGVHHF